jgi:hypothetical protein
MTDYQSSQAVVVAALAMKQQDRHSYPHRGLLSLAEAYCQRRRHVETTSQRSAETTQTALSHRTPMRARTKQHKDSQQLNTQTFADFHVIRSCLLFDIESPCNVAFSLLVNLCRQSPLLKG